MYNLWVWMYVCLYSGTPFANLTDVTLALVKQQTLRLNNHCQRHNEIGSVTWTKFGNNMAPLALVANLDTRWRHLH